MYMRYEEHLLKKEVHFLPVFTEKRTSNILHFDEVKIFATEPDRLPELLMKKQRPSISLLWRSH
jgi:hypothetical protein